MIWLKWIVPVLFSVFLGFDLSMYLPWPLTGFICFVCLFGFRVLLNLEDFRSALLGENAEK